jgi:hypothetical protein
MGIEWNRACRSLDLLTLDEIIALPNAQHAGWEASGHVEGIPFNEVLPKPVFDLSKIKTRYTDWFPYLWRRRDIEMWLNKWSPEIWTGLLINLTIQSKSKSSGRVTGYSFTEMSGCGYQRIYGPCFEPRNDEFLENNIDMHFGPATKKWPAIKGMGIWDSETGGSLLFIIPARKSHTVKKGCQYHVKAGELLVRQKDVLERRESISDYARSDNA